MKKTIVGFLVLPLLVACQSSGYKLIDFPSQEVNFLSDYKISLLGAEFTETMTYQPNSSSDEVINAHASNNKQYLKVTIKISRFVIHNSSGSHPLDNDDFKIKDHTGINLFPNYFPSVNALTDYKWISKNIEAGEEPTVFDVYFELGLNISFSNNLIVLEVDFSILETGLDIPLTYKGD